MLKNRIFLPITIKIISQVSWFLYSNTPFKAALETEPLPNRCVTSYPAGSQLSAKQNSGSGVMLLLLSFFDEGKKMQLISHKQRQTVFE